jgi:hypothetical protein
MLVQIKECLEDISAEHSHLRGKHCALIFLRAKDNVLEHGRYVKVDFRPIDSLETKCKKEEGATSPIGR